MSSASHPERYLGYRAADLDAPWAEFFDESMASLAPHVVEALHHGPQAAPALLAFEAVSTLADPDYHRVENGYAVTDDGGLVVAVRTDMPGVRPAMWDWWFGWHGCDPSRYKLWHPLAHVSAEWADGDNDRRSTPRYVGRTSLIVEYLGSELVRGAINFVAPDTVGLGSTAFDDVAICARVSAHPEPVELGWLIHHVRAVPGGSEMRSRFWLGGGHAAVRGGSRVLNRAAQPILRRRFGNPEARARTLLIHCAQEMSHLAARLPELHTRFGQP